MLHKNIYEAFEEKSQSSNPKSKKKNKKKAQNNELPALIQNAEKVVQKPQQEGGNKQKQPQKPKGVSAEPHPLDRRSGTGMGKEPKKQGGGGGNWGSYKDELKMQDSADKHDLFKDSPKKDEKYEEKQAKTFDEYQNEQQWVVVGGKGQGQESKEEQMKKVLEIEKMAKEEHLEIVDNKKEPEQAEAPKKKKRNKKKKQADQKA
eukprot:TRINITY_DN3952_c0_g2_i18.p2 TRINITY_DN3952_c0_g2~~TRINITY_DN3952_c0_g2_i18.p2  ORF type:complete len:204 (-),score=71.68 TRINITY_DN3952_c0_g2_i18:66-677(-)